MMTVNTINVLTLTCKIREDKKKKKECALEFRDSGDSSMCSSSELSISSSIPVIFPARFGWRAWISGYSRSPVCHSRGERIKTKRDRFKGGTAKSSKAQPRSCFWSMSGAAASIEAVRGSGPGIWTAGSTAGAGTAWERQIFNIFIYLKESLLLPATPIKKVFITYTFIVEIKESTLMSGFRCKKNKKG